MDEEQLNESAAMTAEETEEDEASEMAFLTGDAVVFGEDEDGRLHVLAIRRRWDPFAGFWALPGGHLNPGEDEEAGCRRELEEETGLRVGELVRTGVYGAPGRDPRGRYVTLAYAARIEDGLPVPIPRSDAAEAAWLPVDRVVGGYLPVAYDHRVIVRDAVPIGRRGGAAGVLAR